jgi:hypothetical protein
MGVLGVVARSAAHGGRITRPQWYHLLYNQVEYTTKSCHVLRSTSLLSGFHTHSRSSLPFSALTILVGTGGPNIWYQSGYLLGQCCTTLPIPKNGDYNGHSFSLSSPPCCRHHCGGEFIVVERVIKKSSLSIAYPMLTRTNYTEW